MQHVFLHGCSQMGSGLDDQQMLKLFKETDLDGNGSIDFQEFMTTNVKRVKDECEKRLVRQCTSDPNKRMFER